MVLTLLNLLIIRLLLNFNQKTYPSGRPQGYLIFHCLAQSRNSSSTVTIKKKDNIIIKLTINTLIINSYGLLILINITLVSLKIKELIIAPFKILIKGVRKSQKPLTVFKISLKDILKALHLKVIRIPVEIRKLLPA